MLQVQVPSSIEPMFAAAGWRPSARSYSRVDPLASAHQRAAEVIAEFGGLRVAAVRAGRDLPASDIHFYQCARPEVAAVAQAWSSRLGELAGVASAHHDHITVFVGSDGVFYAFTDPDEKLYSIGSTFGEAMERLLLGVEYGSPIARDA
jgi:hypothetical protein